MNVIPTHSVAAQSAHETPRPALQQAQETSRPVPEPARTEALAQETRRSENRSSDPKTRVEAHTQAQPRDAAPAKTGQDPLVGAILDVFA